jgi:hypothetical protein
MKKKGDKKGLKSTRICYKVSENKNNWSDGNAMEAFV